MKIGIRLLFGVAVIFLIYDCIYLVKDHIAHDGLNNDKGALVACNKFYKTHPLAYMPDGVEMPEGATIGPLCLYPNKITHDFIGFPVYKPASSDTLTFGGA